MRALNDAMVRGWARIGPRYLPFADAATAELPLSRLLRLSLFQVSVGMAAALLGGTLNRVMIVELGVAAWLVAAMLSLPLVFAPFRALIGFRSDTHRSALGWRRVPYIWMGTLLQFGGLAIMPFALLVLSGDTHGPVIYGHIGAALAFLMAGAGLHTTQTAGLALATDLAPAPARPRVVALLYVMLLAGMAVGSLAFGALLADFTQIRLIRVVQGAALLTVVLNVIALWKQETRDPVRTAHDRPRPAFRDAWRALAGTDRAVRFLVAVGAGTAGFAMQDVLLEPYGGEIMKLGVGATTSLTALIAGGGLVAFAYAARVLGRGGDPMRLAGMGALAGVFALTAVIFAHPVGSATLFRAGTALMGFGSGLFAVGTLTSAMGRDHDGRSGLVLGAWGAVQATSAGCAIALGGALRDVAGAMASHGLLGPALTGPAVGYGVVYQLEIVLLFVTLVVIGPLVRPARQDRPAVMPGFGLAQFPG